MSREGELLLRLTVTPGIGPLRSARLLDTFGTATRAFEASKAQWKALDIPVGVRREALSQEAASRAQKVREECARLGVKIVPLGSPDYPADLAAIYGPPPVLFVRGSLPEKGTVTVAVIGTRRPSNHGLQFAYRLARDLAKAGVAVVSGLAVGVDAEGHRAVVDADGRAIAVLPGGPDHPYPQGNRALAQRIVEKGCLLSEYPPGTRITKGNFVGRNRLISGLSRAVAIVEAGAQSGALRTATFALDQGRAVYAMPGRPGDPRVEGSLRLLSEGASLLLGIHDLSFEIGAYMPPGAGMANTCEARPGAGSLQATLDAAFASGSASFDGLLASTGLTAPVLLAQLSRLELDGSLRRGSDGRYYPISG